MENLKALVYGRSLTAYQRRLAQREFEELTNSLNIISTVYLAVMRIDYAGIFEDEMKLFRDKPEAEKHISYMRKKYGNSGHEFDIIELQL